MGSPTSIRVDSDTKHKLRSFSFNESDDEALRRALDYVNRLSHMETELVCLRDKLLELKGIISDIELFIKKF